MNKNSKKGIIDKDIKNVLITILVVFIFIAVFYTISLYLNNKGNINYNDNDIVDNEYIQYDEILAGSSFDVSDSEYLVVYYDSSDDLVASGVSSALTKYKSLEDKTSIYTVDMSNGLNKNYSADEAKLDVDNVNDLKINDTTLIKFNDGNIVESVTGIDEITEYLNK